MILPFTELEKAIALPLVLNCLTLIKAVKPFLWASQKYTEYTIKPHICRIAYGLSHWQKIPIQKPPIKGAIV